MAWLGLVIVLVALALLTRWLSRKIGFKCWECDGRVKFFDTLDRETQDEVLSCFRRREGRRPVASALFVCSECGRVYDDFSGEKRSLESDPRSFCKVCGEPAVTYFALPITRGVLSRCQRINPGLMQKYECLRCERDPRTDGDCVLCDTTSQAWICFECGAVHAWERWRKGKLQFLVPQTDRPVLADAPADRHF